MSIASYILGIVASLVTLGIVLEMLRRRRLRERHAIWWIIASLLALVAGVFPTLLAAVAKLLGVAVPTNLVFFVSIAILVLVCLQHSSELTQLESKTRKLAERVALLDMRLKEIEGDKAESSPPAKSRDSSPKGRSANGDAAN